MQNLKMLLFNCGWILRKWERRAKDSAPFIEMIENLVNSMPENPIIQRPELSKLYHEQAQVRKRHEQQQ